MQKMYNNVKFGTTVTITLGSIYAPDGMLVLNFKNELVFNYKFKDIDTFRSDIINKMRYHKNINIFGIQTLTQFEAVYAILKTLVIHNSLLEIMYIDSECNPLPITYDGVTLTIAV